MIIHVTKSDIRDGRPGRPCSCPISLAIKRAVPRSEPSVDPHSIRVLIEGKPGKFETPKEAADFIFRFDRKKPVETFSFDLPILKAEAKADV